MPDVSIVVPALNEAIRLPETLAALERHLAARVGPAEIVVVDDGSTDGTADLVDARPRTGVPVRCIRLPVNRGKGRAVVTGIAASSGTVVAFLDADLPYALADLDRALDLVARDAADVALGTRNLPGSRYDPSYPLARQVAGRVYAALVRIVLGLPFGETQCGLKSFRRAAADQLFPLLTIDGWGFDVELVYLAHTRGWRIARFPVTLSHRHESRVRLLHDSRAMFADLFRVRRNDARGVYALPGSADGPDAAAPGGAR